MTDLTLRYILFGEDKNATSTMGKVGSAVSKLGSTIGGEFGDLVDRIGDGLDSLAGKQATLGQKFMGAGGLGVAVGGAMSMMGSANVKATAQLDAAIKASGHNIEDYQDKIDGAIASMQDFGHSDDDTQDALRKMTSALGDPTKALAQMGTVADLAAAQHMSLSDAADQVDKILAGKGTRTLSQFGITLDTSIKDPTERSKTALFELHEKLDGQASASVDNFAGKVGIIRTKLGDWTADMSAKFGPAVQAAGGALMALGIIMQTGVIQKIAGMVSAGAVWLAQNAVSIASTVAHTAAMAASMAVRGAVIVATGAWTAAQWLLNAALDANPIGLVVIAIAALVGGVILAYNHFTVFRNIVNAAWDGIKKAVGAVVGWFENTVWPDIKKVVGFVAGIWGDVISAIGGVVDWVKGHWPLLLGIITGPIGLAIAWVATHWNTVTTLFSNVVGTIKSVFGGVVGAITAPFKAAFNGISDLWNNTLGKFSIQIPKWVPGFGGNTFSLPQMPHLAAGGVATRPTVALIGEAGPEAVIPLNRAGGIGTHVTVNVPVGFVGSEQQLADAIVRTLQRAQGSGMRLGFAG